MCIRLYVNAISSVAMMIVTLAGPSTVNAQIAEKQENIAPVFDPDALVQTIKELKTLTTVDLFETSVKDILNEFTKRHNIKFKVEASRTTPVTMTIREQSFGKMLTELLATVNCEYAILPNGVIIVRESPKIPSGKRDKTALP